MFALLINGRVIGTIRKCVLWQGVRGRECGNLRKMGVEKKIRVYLVQNGRAGFLHIRGYHLKEPSILSVLPTSATLETISRKEPMAVLAGAIGITMDTR
jgi:hypothetical protein